MHIIKVTFKKSKAKDKRYAAVFKYKDGDKIRKKTVNFGHPKYENYTTHKDKERRDRYIKRHEVNGFDNPMTPNTLSCFILWGKYKTVKRNISDYKKHFKIKEVVKSI